METGTQILLQRMKDNPEEFANEGELHGKWGRLIHDARNILPTEDVEAIDKAYKQLMIDRFNEGVLKTLAGEVPKEETVKIKMSERYAKNVGWTDPRALYGAVAKGEGQAVNYDHNTDSYKQMINARELEIQNEMRARVMRGAAK